MTEEAPRAGHNGFDPAKAEAFIKRVERIEADIGKEKSDYMNTCKALREDIKNVLNEAKDAGLPKAAMKAVLKARTLERKLEEAREDLDPDMQDTYDNIRLALGDLAELPLGQAAMSKSMDELAGHA